MTAAHSHLNAVTKNIEDAGDKFGVAEENMSLLIYMYV